MIKLVVAPEEAAKLKKFVEDFLGATHGLRNVSNVVITSIKKIQDQIEVKGTFDGGPIFQIKIINFTIVLDSNYSLISYERN